MYVIRILIVKYHNLGELLEYSCVSHTLFVEFFFARTTTTPFCFTPPTSPFSLPDFSRQWVETNEQDAPVCTSPWTRSHSSFDLPASTDLKRALLVLVFFDLRFKITSGSMVYSLSREQFDMSFKSTAIHRFPGLLRDDFEGQEKVDHTVHGFIQFNTIT